MPALQFKETVLVVFGKELPVLRISKRKFDVIVAEKALQKKVEALRCQFVELKTFVGLGSIYKASVFLEELSHLKSPDGSRLAKSALYKGYELWWIHYGNLFLYFCFPYTQYRRLLEYLKSFHRVYFYQSPHESLFSCYLRAHGCEVTFLHKQGFRMIPHLPFGIFIQIVMTLLSIPILMVRKRCTMLFIGDKFEKFRDYDFRMKFIYEELRERNLPFVEFIRSLESWKIVLKHVIKRKRPVIYSEAVTYAGRLLSIIFGGRRYARQKFGFSTFDSEVDPEMRFRLLVTTQYLLGVYDDIWAIRLMKLILRIIGVKVAMIPAATERNFHTVLGCKLNNISTVGILHGVASRHSAPYDFMPGFDGRKMLSVDSYGLWSEWWKKYYIKYSKAYKPEQLYVSGPMRPLEVSKESDVPITLKSGLVRVLFISEQTVSPSESIPYLRELLDRRDIKLTIKFRPYRDGFEEWLLEHEPEILKREHVSIIKGGMQEAIRNNDVVVGSRSTAVLEALLQLKVPIFFQTQKWGDYYGMLESREHHPFFAGNPAELIKKIKGAHSLSFKLLVDLREQYFGDPHKNGSKWVVARIEQILQKSR